MHMVYEKIVILDEYLVSASITAGSLRFIDISTLEYMLWHLCVNHLPSSTNAAMPCIIESCL